MDLRESQPPPHPPPPQMVGHPNSYAPNLPNNNSSNNNTSPPMMQNPRFPFNSVASSTSKPMEPLNTQFGDGSHFSIEPARKKRGRPRKYSPDGGNIALGLAPTPAAAPVTPISSSVVLHGDSGGGGLATDTPAKKSRGRPPGSGKKQLDALGSIGGSFIPHVILVKAGEDIASKIMAFSQQGPRTVCILSANGAISNVTLRQHAMSGGTVTYEGRYEIISLSGSFFMSESNGSHSRTGGLSVSLAGSDGRVLGGGVVGMLVAASPVQVIVGSFIADGKKSKSGQPSTPMSNILNFGAPVAAASPPSQGPSSESSDENGGSPFNRVSGSYNNASQPVHSMSMYSNMGWGNSM
ncbi:AT-hook motif nuclear-localized protein 13-like [Actinidia eriantha]|uniref:AT-hook motif nuclear-localized protein 13-like n=1 Tax=Actinidia eriantha TaxID=165200 RepID=UPI00258F4524|nr:AT-hook motif nuclear-localized protein 13-like [Actinidia eriantha]